MARKQRRKEVNRDARSVVSTRPIIPTIIGAGITEQWYFKHLQTIGAKIKVKPRFCGREDINQLEKRIERVLNDDGKAIVVFDTDTTRDNRKEAARLKAFKKKYEKDERVLLCDSLPSIEYWFLLHYEYTTRYFNDSDAVAHELNKKKYINGFSKDGDFLKHASWVSDMCCDGRLQTACQHAKQSIAAGGESYTNVHKAIEEIGISL